MTRLRLWLRFGRCRLRHAIEWWRYRRAMLIDGADRGRIFPRGPAAVRVQRPEQLTPTAAAYRCLKCLHDALEGAALTLDSAATRLCDEYPHFLGQAVTSLDEETVQLAAQALARQIRVYGITRMGRLPIVGPGAICECVESRHYGLAVRLIGEPAEHFYAFEVLGGGGPVSLPVGDYR